MSPWQIIFDAIGWALIAVVGVGAAVLWCRLIADYARALWDARGEAPTIYDDARYVTFTTTAPNLRTPTTSQPEPSEPGAQP